jgi:preprotein translocase SecE subunit
MDDKKVKQKDETAASGKSKFSEWFGGISGEFKRITWPSRPELAKMVVTVIVTSGIFGGIIVLYDFILAIGYDALAGLFR